MISENCFSGNSLHTVNIKFSAKFFPYHFSWHTEPLWKVPNLAQKQNCLVEVKSWIIVLINSSYYQHSLLIGDRKKKIFFVICGVRSPLRGCRNLSPIWSELILFLYYFDFCHETTSPKSSGVRHPTIVHRNLIDIVLYYINSCLGNL